MKPLSPLEIRCHAALQAFQEQHDRLPSLRELIEAAGFSGGSQTTDVLHRLVCKGWIETDKLPPPEPPLKVVKTKQPRLPKPRASTFVPAPTEEKVSAVLVREIFARLEAGTTKREFLRECGVQWLQLQALLANGTSLRTPAIDRLCRYLHFRLLPSRCDREAYERLSPTEALRKAMADERAAGATLVEICRAAEVNANNLSEFAKGRCSLNLTTVDALCRVLGLELKPATPHAASAPLPAAPEDRAPSDTSQSPRTW